MIAPDQSLPPEDTGKDAFFTSVAELSEQMIAAYGRDFAMGTLILAAQWIAANKIGPDPARH